MGHIDLQGLIATLVDADDRVASTRGVAAALGVDEVIVLSRDPGTDAYLPVPGSRKTLPGGTQWRRLLSGLGKSALQRAMLPTSKKREPVGAIAISNQDIAIVLLGGDVEDALAARLCSMLPLLSAVLRSQQALAIAQGELAASRYELKQSAALMKSLDDTRRQHDRTLIELDVQAQSLSTARARAEQATLAKDRFLAMLGHELRNPLSPIVTALELIRHRGLWSPEHEIMHRQVRHLLRLVDDLLDISRITGDKLVLAREHLELATVVELALEMSSPLLVQRRHSVDTRVPPSGLCVFGDPARLAQVFSNLITNAAKYSNPGSPITITARRCDDVVRVEVVDRGIGIDPQMLEGIFEMFQQQERGLDRSQGGLGLGLAIVRNLVVQHGGHVEALSEGHGQGSCFVVELPIEAAPVRHIASGDIEAPAPGHTPAAVLVVDDNADAASTLASVLRYAGFAVRTAGDGLSALRMAAEFRPDAALLDIGLPVMDGYELARRLRAEYGSGIRLVAITGYGRESDRLLAEAAGFDAHLVKPVDLAMLDRLLADLVGTAEERAS
ncbi:MAG: response regulator [Lysobacter sp.]|nr:response regulator [Lysobacter sp.]MDQ3268822.1 ATP-binding protein [Pseudomonadota bacterium]